MIRAVIRLRSGINVKPGIKKTLVMLRLTRVNHCVLLPPNEINDGMLQKVKDYVTWGEVKPDVLTRLILIRGRLEGNRPIENKYVKESTNHDSLVKFAGAVATGKEPYNSLKGVKPIFRLHPPLRGHEGLKRHYKAGGALGYRGEAINDLITKMLGPEEVPKKKEPKPKKTAPKKAESKKPAPKKKPQKKKAVEKKPAKKAPAAKKAPVAKKAPAKKREVKK